MSLFSALMKLAMRSTNDRIKKREIKKAKAKAFKDTKTDIKKAKKQKRHINASKSYRTKVKKNMSAVNQRHKRREKFIDDL